MSTPHVAVRDLRVSYGERLAVDGVSFDVAPATLFGIIGPNGSGKSTTLKALIGELSADAGTISFQGKPLNRVRSRVA